MVNQWGRDGNFSSSGSRSSGAGAIVISAIVALVLGAGGGYAGARLLGGASAGELQSRDNRIAGLEKQVADLQFTSSGNDNQENILREKVTELTKANQSLKDQLNDNDSKVGADAEAEIAALKKTIEQAGDVRAELNRARRSQQVSELQIIELEGEIKTQRTELDKLRKSMTASSGQDDAAAKTLADQIKRLETSLAAARKQVAAAADLKTQLASAEDDLAQKTGELSVARGNITALRKEVDKNRAESETLRRQLADAAARGDMADLEKNLANTQKLLAQRDKELRDMTTNARQAQIRMQAADANVAKAQAEAARVGSSLRKAETERDKLVREVAALKDTIEGLRSASGADEPQPDVTTPDDATQRRDADAVRNALDDMPGYGRLTPEQQVALARRLEDGACAADALKVTLGRVPAIALRNLIRDLGSKC
ncbi:hypothetical protein [Rhizobium sp.]